MKKTALFLFIGLVSFLVSCDSSGIVEKQDPTISRISGVASKGGAIANASVYIKDNKGDVFTSETDTEGKYEVDVPDAEGPFVLMTEEGTGDTAEHLYSAAPEAGRVNVSPATHTIVATAVGKDPENAFPPDKMKNDSELDLSGITETVLDTAKDTVKQILKNVIGDDTDENYQLLEGDFDPIASDFSADGTGFDQLLGLVDIGVKCDETTGDIEEVEVEVGEATATVDPNDPNDVNDPDKYTEVNEEYTESQGEEDPEEGYPGTISIYLANAQDTGLTIDFNVKVIDDYMPILCAVQLKSRIIGSDDPFVNTGDLYLSEVFQVEDGYVSGTIMTGSYTFSETYTVDLYLFGKYIDANNDYTVYSNSLYYDSTGGDNYTLYLGTATYYTGINGNGIFLGQDTVGIGSTEISVPAWTATF